MESTWSLPRMFILMASIESKDIGGGLSEDRGSSMTLVKSCDDFVFRFLTYRVLKCYDFVIKNSASNRWLYTPTNTGSVCPHFASQKEACSERKMRRECMITWDFTILILLQIKINVADTY